MIFGFEDSNCLVRRNHFEGAKAVENTVKDLSEDIIGKGANPSLIYNLVPLQIDIVFAMFDDSIFLHSVDFALYVTSLAFIVMIQFNKGADVEIPVVNNFRGHNSSGSLVSSVQSMAFSRDSSYQLAADSTGSWLTWPPAILMGVDIVTMIGADIDSYFAVSGKFWLGLCYVDEGIFRPTGEEKIIKSINKIVMEPIVIKEDAIERWNFISGCK